MRVSGPPDDDVLASPARARLFDVLVALRGPATTDELAARVGRHPNSVRVQLQHLETAGLVECRTQRLARGRPRHSWVVEPGARPGGAKPDAHADLSRWLARALRGGTTVADIEEEGRRIGQELAPELPAADGDQAMHDALAALGFAPRMERASSDRLRYTLGNCPYREAVTENAAVICSLHRGISQGLLDRLNPRRELSGFVAKDPYAAGCLIETTG